MGRSSSFSSLFSLVGEMARASRPDPFASLRPSGVEGAAGDAAGGREAGDGQPVDDPSLSWLAHGDGGDAAGGKCQQEQGEGGGDPLDDQRGSE